MSSQTTSNSDSMGLASIITIIFVVFKLIGKITWSWWWVLSPLWISVILCILIFFVVFVGAVVVETLK